MAKGHRSQIKRERNANKDTRPSAKLSYARVSVQKACFVLDAIRGKDVTTALAILEYNPRYASSVIKKLLQKDEYDAIITLGAVIEGATDHDQIVAQHASRKIADLALEYDTPVALGITGPGMTRLDAHRRVKNAKSAVEAAIKMCDRLKEI